MLVAPSRAPSGGSRPRSQRAPRWAASVIASGVLMASLALKLAQLLQVRGQTDRPLKRQVADVDEAIALLVGPLARLVTDERDAARLAALRHARRELFEELLHLGV